MTVENVITADEKVIPIGSLEQAIFRHGDGRVNYFQVVFNGITYRQTLSYDASLNVSAISRWVKQ